MHSPHPFALPLLVRTLLSFTLILIVPLGLLTVAARALGSHQPLNPAIQSFVEGCEDKPEPCWFGIVPGVTTEDEAFRLMGFDNGPRMMNRLIDRESYVFTLPESLPYCHAIVEFRNSMVLQVELSLCRDPMIRVGDLATLVESKTPVVSLPPEELMYGSFSMNVDGWPSPFSRILYVMMFSPNEEFRQYPWYGFIVQRRYCQLVPNYPACPRSTP